MHAPVDRPGAVSPGMAGAAGGRRGFWRRLACTLVLADRIARDRRYLAAMDERMLRDIGLHRGEVAEELRRPISLRALWHRCCC